MCVEFVKCLIDAVREVRHQEEFTIVFARKYGSYCDKIIFNSLQPQYEQHSCNPVHEFIGKKSLLNDLQSNASAVQIHGFKTFFKLYDA